jgi:hypothetical protein
MDDETDYDSGFMVLLRVLSSGRGVVVIGAVVAEL